MENIEIEYKVMIDQSGYIKMKKWMEEQKFVLMNQINQYYDTQDGRLKKNKISLVIATFFIYNLNSMHKSIVLKGGSKKWQKKKICSLKWNITSWIFGSRKNAFV